MTTQMADLACNKKIIIGITGGIAAYKTAELVRLLRKNNHEVAAKLMILIDKYFCRLDRT